jgi:outer membrane protein assembly factor BamB
VFRIIDVDTGAIVADKIGGRPAVATRDTLVCRTGSGVCGVDRTTFVPLWERDIGWPNEVAATADAVVITEQVEQPKQRRFLVERVLAVDPRTGAELWRVDLSPHDAFGGGTLVAGRLVFLSYNGGPPLVVVE